MMVSRNDFVKAGERMRLSKMRSAWEKGVKAYALQMANKMERLCYERGDMYRSLEEAKEAVMGGARNWREASYGGMWLVRDGDIAGRLCTITELKRCKGGEKAPNKDETWLDVQARALAQAWGMLAQSLVAVQQKEEGSENGQEKD